MTTPSLEEIPHGLRREQSLGPVPRVSVGFFERLGPVKPRVPLIVRDAMDSWPAMRTWTPEGLKAKIGDRVVNVFVNTGGVSNRSGLEGVQFRDFVDAVLPERPREPWHLGVGSIYARRPPKFMPHRVARYFHRFPTPVFPELAEDVKAEVLIDPRTIIETNIWIAYNGAVTKLHFDQTDNLLAMVGGRKRIIMFDPAETKWLYAEHGLDANFNFSKIDPEKVDAARFPDVARAKYWECILEPGEVLYMPAHLWHHVRSEGFCVSANVWFTRAHQYLSERVLRRAVTMAADELGLINRLGVRAARA